MNNKSKLLNNVQLLAIVCNQWGDTGKGKFVDYFAEWADVIARGTGGANAGHTIKVNNEEHIFNLIPSGILYDQYGKTNILGNGMVLLLPRLLEEMKNLDNLGISYDNLKISGDAHVTMPYHILLELVAEKAKGKDAIGTTLKAIGPTYENKMRRNGIRMSDLSDYDTLRKKTIDNYETIEAILKGKYHQTDKSIAKLMQDPRLGSGKFVSNEKVDLREMVHEYLNIGVDLEDFITDTREILADARKAGKKILLEGAQGKLLCIDHGTYPFVTSSNPGINGLCEGVGVPGPDVDLCLGLVKAPYMTRVGAGPFPTKISGDLEQHLRKIGHEYGATTGRPRDVGWLDAVALKHAIESNGRNIVFTKMDVCDDQPELPICTGYKFTGEEDVLYQGTTIQPGQIITKFITDGKLLQQFEPVFGVTMPGWMTKISYCEHYSKLPQKARDYVEKVEELTGANVRIVSVGPDRNQTIVR